jgi:hypothetical protein
MRDDFMSAFLLILEGTLIGAAASSALGALLIYGLLIGWTLPPLPLPL